MIATRRGLVVLCALALLALVLVVVDRPRGHAPLDRALVPGLDIDHITSLRWEAPNAVLAIAPAPGAATGEPAEGATSESGTGSRATGEPAADATSGSGTGGRATGGSATGSSAVDATNGSSAGSSAVDATSGAAAWRFVEPAYGAVDRAALSNVFAALRGARWHRRDAASAAGEATRALVIRDGAREHVVRFGRAIEGAEQVWLIVDGHALLVDAWVARTLDPGALALAIRRPFESSERGSMRIGDMRLDGHPRVASGEDGRSRVVVAASLAEEVARALGDLELQRLVAGSPPPPTRSASPPAPALLELRAGDVTGVLGGECPGAPALVLLRASTGSGCVTAEAAARARSLAATLAGPSMAYVERRLAPVEPVQITLADGGVLDLRKRALIDGAPADPTRVAELLAVLAAPADLALGAPREDKARGRITIEHAGGTLVLELFTDRRVRRGSERLYFTLSPTAWELLARPSRALRELALWSEEPTTLTRIDLDGVTYQRGAVVGEWTRASRPAAGARADTSTSAAPVGAAVAARLDALAVTLAAPRPIAAEAPAFTPRHRVAIVITPPTGAPATHRLELGAPAASGCPARADGTSIVLARATCDAVDALTR